MSIKKDTIEINSMKKGEAEIGQAYLGDKLVFDHDRAVWMIRTNLHWMISQDGLTFSKIEDSRGDYWVTPVVVSNNKFIFATPPSSGTNKIPVRLYDIKKLRDNAFNFVTVNADTSSNARINAMASNGSNLVVIISDVQDRPGLYYSTNGGVSWARIVVSDIWNDGIRYIGNNEFLIQKGDRGFYTYFDGNSLTVKTRTPDMSVVSGGAKEIIDMWVCNNMVYYNVSTNSSSSMGTYVGTKTKLIQKVSSPATYLGYITYIYGKYYAITNLVNLSYARPGTEATGNYSHLYVSTDGRTFTAKSNFAFPGYARQMEKNNGRLQILGVNFFGYIDENEELHYTSFTRNSSSWNEDNEPVAGFVCNKFHKF